MKDIILIFLFSLSMILFILVVSATNISSPDYSGYFTQGSADGNIASNSNYSGNTASFYQQAIGYISDSLYQGIHGFSFQLANPFGYVPSLSIIKPINGTYITGTNIPLNFTGINSDYVWYNLDQGSNITLNGNTTFSTTSGGHTLYLYANNSNGNSIASVTFAVNSSKFLVYYNNYSISTRGNSTDFNKSSYEELQNLSNVILENTNFGKIVFNSALNLTNSTSNNYTNLDSYITISSNSMGINTTILSNLNTSATLYLYNLTFSNPRILRDGTVCSSSICTKQSYSGGTLIFNVTGFSVYSTEETPAGETGISTASVTGGGGGSVWGASFIVDKGQISVSLSQGEVKTEEITIKNTGSQTATLQINNTLRDFIVRSDDSIILKPGESKTVQLYVLARVDTIPDLYLGKIIVSQGGIEKEILVAVNVGSKGSLFDVAADIPTQYLTVSPGDDLLTNVKIYNFGAESKTDAQVQYLIKDENGNTITTLSDTIAVQTQTSYTKTINIPENTTFGKYVLYVSVAYNGKIASSSIFFNVAASSVSQREKIYIMAIIVLSIVLSVIIYYAITRRERHNKKGGKKTGERMEEIADLKDLLKK